MKVTNMTTQTNDTHTDTDSWGPHGSPIPRAFAKTYAQLRGFPTTVRLRAPQPRGELLVAPEEVLHNVVLRDDLEAQLDPRPRTSSSLE